MISTKYPVYVNFVEKKKTKEGKVYTRFQIGDKVKDGDTYQNYTVTVWEDLNIKNKDKVLLTSINNIETKQYKNNVYHSFIATVDAPKNEPQKASEKQDEYSDTELPFDI